MKLLSLITAIVIALLQGCAGSVGSESELENTFRGQFFRWYKDNPPSTAQPSQEDIILLERYKPIYFLPENSRDPIDFYADYIARGTLYDEQGDVIVKNPDQATLNKYRRDPDVEFVHDGIDGNKQGTATVYGRVERDEIPFETSKRELVFLTYTLAFEISGVPQELSWWKELGASIAGDVDDWHQLDHYVNVTIALNETIDPPEPIAATFQQHNYLRTYRLGGASGKGRLQWPEDNRLRVDIALRSNENFPHQEGTVKRRAASFMDLKSARWLILGEDPPFQSGYDVTSSERRLDDLNLVALPHADAFYTFFGSLGESRLLPGRSGPPGADFNTLAALKSPSVQLFVNYWHEDMNDSHPALLAGTFNRAWRGEEIDLKPFAKLFYGDWEGL